MYRSGLYGDTPMEQVKCDMIVDCCEDVLQNYFMNAVPEEMGKRPTTDKVSFCMFFVLEF